MFGSSLKTQSVSSAQLQIVDRCPRGYACSNETVYECPPGFYCMGGGQSQMPRQCPIGFYQDKSRSYICKQCPKGKVCPFAGMSKPITCPAGFLCNQEKANSPQQQCYKGYYCLQGTQEYDQQFVTLYPQIAQRCTQGSYCKGGSLTGVVLIDSNSSTPAACKQGSICYAGSTTVGGAGLCPAGYYCPTPYHNGILCPPRHYCSQRGNINPIKCPRGTFNMHYGQKNCTTCTIGYYCPLKGMLMPTACPRGYGCNTEGLIYPINFCKAGHICLGSVMTSTAIAERSCKISEIVAQQQTCDTNILYKNAGIFQFSAQSLPSYFFGKDVCCHNASFIANYIQNIGLEVNQFDTFQSYGYQINKTMVLKADKTFGFLWDGMRVIDKAVFKQNFNSSDQLQIPIKKHRDLLLNHFQLMYTSYQQHLCPGGYLCLEGVYTTTTGSYLMSMPFSCPLGSYCLIGSDSVIGTGLCPEGYYCQSQTQYPQAAAAGTYTGSEGAVYAQDCPPGTFSLTANSVVCTTCPDGYECKDKGTSKPTICQIGNYRSVVESAICTSCPRGTFSFERGIRDSLECLECPAGRICDSEGITNISQSVPCTDGKVCPSGTGARTQFDCPPGYYCPPQTTNDTQRNYLCQPGFYCTSGTGNSTKTRNVCPQTYYCPQGTGNYTFKDQTDYSDFQLDAPTRCPQGTGQDGDDTKSSLTQCGINTIFALLQNSISIRPYYSNTSLTYQQLSTTSSVLTMDQSLISGGNRRMLQSLTQTQLTTTQQAQLSSLYEIEFEIGEYNDNNKQMTYDTQQFINLNRHYIARWCPLNISLVSEYIQIENMTQNVLEENVPNVIFEMQPFAYALITLDLRHLLEQSFNWTYGEDWQISFTLGTNLTIEQFADPIPMPEQFLSNQTQKGGILEFQVFAWTYTRLRVDILLYNKLYINYRHLFINSTSVEIRTPNRAIYGNDQIFMTSIVQSYQITLPLNIPKLMPKKDALPTSLVSFAQSIPNWNPIQQSSIKNRNIWIPNSLYWGDRERINLPYLPYFSNCYGYGQYTPLWALMEQNYGCDLVDYNDTKAMQWYLFGQKPKSDVCSQVLTTCVYDELFYQSQPFTRWFEISSDSSLFDITIDPVTYEESLTAVFSQTDVLTFVASTKYIDANSVPKLVAITISYYQMDKATKRIIIVELDFDNYEELSEEEYNGLKKVEYNLTFNLYSLSHTDLTIAFAFKWYFYVILYFIVGIVSIVVIFVFMYYHKKMARPKLNRPLASFKFFSYIKLSIPPVVIGMFLAMFPIMVVNFLICAFFTGDVMGINFNIYKCEVQTTSSCLLTLFDSIKDNPNDANIDYDNLRTGRTGTALLIFGLYLMYIGLIILIPDKSKGDNLLESYDGNIWEFYTWKRSNMLFCTAFVIFLNVAVIQFSFSAVFSKLIWYMIASYTLGSILVERILENTLKEKLLLAPLSVTNNLVLQLVTFGSSDFLQFLISYFVGMGIQMFQRPYMSIAFDWIFDILEGKYPEFANQINKWVKNEDELAERPDAKKEEKEEMKTDEQLKKEHDAKSKKIQYDEDSQESSKSDIVYTDEESIESNDDLDGLGDENQVYLFDKNGENESDIASVNLSHEIKNLIHKKFDKNNPIDEQQMQQQEQSEDDDEEEFDDYDEKSDKGKNESDFDENLKRDQDLEVEEVEPLLETYLDFANDSLSLLYNPFFTILLWIFYQQTVVAEQYGIPIQDFVYYFLFSIVIIPFQIVIDVCCYNIIEWYHLKPFHDYLDYLAYRFQTRKARWKGNETNVNVLLSENLRSLDQLCFSAQHYFVLTIYVAGIQQVILGIQTLLWASNYNMFSDIATIPLIFLVLGTCILIQRVCLFIGKKRGIWKIDEQLEKLAQNNEEETLGTMFQKILDPSATNRKVKDKKGYFIIPDEIKFRAEKWKNVDRVRLDEEQNKNDLQTDRLIAQTFRDLFLKYNKPWLQEQMYEIFTPRTLFLHRKDIIQQFTKVMGELKPDIPLSDHKSDNESDSHESDYLKDNEKEKKIKERKEFNQQQLERIQEDMTDSTQAIIKLWIMRARIKQRVSLQVNKIIEGRLQRNCLYCGAIYGLKVELIQNIENMFYSFLQETQQDLANFDTISWQQYFSQNGAFRTICLDCAEQIERFHVKLKRNIRLYEQYKEKQRKYK